MFDSASPLVAPPDLPPGLGAVTEEPQRTLLWISTDDCAAAVERLRAGGVTISQEPERQPWGETVARVRDPDSDA